MNLGTERHKKQYFDAIDKFKIPGESHTNSQLHQLSRISRADCSVCGYGR